MAQNILGILAGQAPADEDPLRIRQGGQAFRGLAQADVQNGGPEAAAVFLNAHGPPGAALHGHHPAFMGQHGGFQSHGPGTRADIPDHMARSYAQQGQRGGAYRLFADQLAFHGQLLGVQAQVRPARELAGDQQQGAGRAESATGRLGQAQLMPGLRRARPCARKYAP